MTTPGRSPSTQGASPTPIVCSGAASSARMHAIGSDALTGFAQAVGHEVPVSIAGARTRWEVGGALAAGARVLEAPRGIVQTSADEMTVRVFAGTPVAELHAALAEQGQRTGLPERGGTVGGALAVGEDDPRLPGRRRVRETLLQARYVSAEGRVVTGGGPTVKNVSGYDLPRLLVGSLGTLGLLAEVLLRTDPVPAVSRWFAADHVDPFAVDDALHVAAAVLWDGTRTWVLLEGHEPDVGHERDVLARHGAFDEVDGPPELPPHRWALRRSQLRDLSPADLGAFVANVAVGTVFAEQAQPRDPPAPGVADLAKRVKAQFDPTGRLNPGRDPALR